ERHPGQGRPLLRRGVRRIAARRHLCDGRLRASSRSPFDPRAGGTIRRATLHCRDARGNAPTSLTCLDRCARWPVMANLRKEFPLRLVDDPVAHAPGNMRPPVPAPTDVELLDAYSKAVVHVVEKVGPAVVGVTVRGARGRAGGGSGVLFTPDGYVLTNAHVVAAARRVRVSLTGGSGRTAVLVG